MNGALIVRAFEAAGKEIENDRKYPRAEHLAMVIEDARLGETISPRTLVHYYENALKNEREAVPLRPLIREALLQYLGFSGYREFLREHTARRKGEMEEHGRRAIGIEVKRRRIRIDFSISISL